MRRLGVLILCGVGVALLVVSPASAADPGPTGSITALPMPMPVLPAPVRRLQSSDLPAINPSSWAQIESAGLVAVIRDARITVLGEVRAQLYELNSELLQQRELSNYHRQWVGAPLTELSVNAGGESRTGVALAQDFTTGIATTFSYVRGLNRLGGVGLSLTFVMYGLGWIFLVNLIDTYLQFQAFLIAYTIRVLLLVFRFFDFIVQILQAIGGFIPFT